MSGSPAHDLEMILREHGSGKAHVSLRFKSGNYRRGYLWELLTYECADDSTSLNVRVGDPFREGVYPFCTDFEVDSIESVDMLS